MITRPGGGRPEVAMFASFALAVVLLIAIWISALRSSLDGVTTFTGARSGLAVFVALSVLAIAFRDSRIWAPRALSWAPVVLSALFVSIAGFLFTTGRLDSAFALYGGLQVSRSDKIFSDMHWVLSWFECGLCSQWDPHYGPTLGLLNPLTTGSLGLAWLAPLGIGTVLFTLVAIWILARRTSSFGQWLLLLAAMSPAWLLLLDRANSDAFILTAIVTGAWAVHRWPNYWSWSAFAVGLWVLGTIKFYPFALGIMLLFALLLRRGWLVVVGFLAASSIYMALAWDWYERSSAWTVRPDLFDIQLASYGRVYVETAIAAGGEGFPWVAVTLGLLLMSGAAWGWGLALYRKDLKVNAFVGLVALGGGVAFAGKVLWAGFGFAYTGAFLLLVVPAIAVSVRRGGTFSGSTIAAGLLALVAVFSPASVVLGTLAGIIVSGLGLGAGLAVWWRLWRDGRGQVGRQLDTSGNSQRGTEVIR